MSRSRLKGAARVSLFRTVGLCTTLALASCATPPAPHDGELALPADYRSWPIFLRDVQRPDNRQVRDIYVNAAGSEAESGEGFPYGTILIMENHKARLNADGSLQTGADGRLVKGDTAAIFVMGKGRGWGVGVPGALATGEWVFAAYKPDGSRSDADLNACRGCHAPLGTKDFVHRYDEYFAHRSR